jgi:hypothetical protein
MRNKWWSILIFVVIAAPFTYSNTSAMGLGLYIEGSGGSLDDWEVDTPFGDIDLDGDSEKGILGFVLDTAVAKDTLFNYRLNLGIGGFVADFDQIDEDLEMGGVVLDNTFGFGVVRTDTVRLWLGPQIRIAYYTGEFEDSDFGMDIVEVGLAPVLGLNLHVGQTVTFSFSAGYRISGYAGEDDDSNDVEGTGEEFFGNIGLIFRLAGDSYR